MSTTIHISNLPLDSTIYQINTEFCKIGDIKRSFLVKDGNKQPVGEAFVSFRNASDAASAVSKLHGSEFGGNNIELSLTESNETSKKADLKEPKQSKKKKKSKDISNGSQATDETQSKGSKKRPLSGGNAASEVKAKKPKVKDDALTAEIEKKLALQASRVMVKNIPDSVNEDTVKNFYSRFGSITEVKFPASNKFKKSKKSAFIQFTNKTDAQLAISEGPETPFMEHKVSIQLAVPKDKFQGLPKNNAKTDENDKKSSKPQPVVDFAVIVRNLSYAATKQGVQDYFSKHCKVSKVLFPHGKGCCFVHFKEERFIEEAIEKFNLTEFMERTITVQKALSKETYTSSTDLGEGEFKSVPVKQERLDPEKFQHAKKSRDVEEQRTLFISDLTLDTTQHSLEAMLSQWGELKYVLLCKNKLTETNSGKAFAQFLSKEAADECLEAYQDPGREADFMINHKLPKVMRALARDEVPTKTTKKGGKDKRNLMLLSEGFVKGGNRSAEGVSQSDLKMRRLRTEAREQALKNLHNRVSKTRLQVNNLPQDLNKDKLLEIFKKYSPKGAVINEARVLYHTERAGPDGKPLSRGYGFVEYGQHEHARAALHAVNNNPEVFTVQRRPIVEFAIENINKMKKLEKKKGKNKPAGQGNATSVDDDASVRKQHDATPFAGYMAKKGDARGGKVRTAPKDRKKRKGSKKGKTNSRSRVHPKNKKK